MKWKPLIRIRFFLLLFLAPCFSAAAMTQASIPLGASAGFGRQFTSGAANVIEAMTQLQIMQMFQQQQLEPGDIAAINFYKPFLASIMQLDERSRNAIFQEALSKPLNDKKLPLIGFCENAYAVALSQNIFSQEQQNKLKQEMGVSLLGQATSVTNTSFFSFMKNAFAIGLALGTVECMKRVIGDSLSRVVNKIPYALSFAGRLASKGYNTLCNRPDALQPEELAIWRSTIEGVINALCEQSVSGALMLKNVRLEQEEQESIVDDNWIYLTAMVKEVCEQAAFYLEERIPYYTGSESQRALFVGVANSFSMENRASISFLSKIIAQNLRNIIVSCQKTQTAEDLDVTHVKKLGRITLLLFDKLHLMISGDQQMATNHQALLAPDYQAV